MIPSSREDQKKEAFRLFEDGRYLESLQYCNVLLETGRDQAVEVLSATNLYYTGKLEDAEVFFKDLARKMPDSSYVHSYLAKVLEAREDEGAIAEYAAAVHLDPTNQDALRSYADYLFSHGDFRGAVPVFRRLVQQGRKPEDVRNLIRALLEIGEAREAVITYSILGGEMAPGHEMVDALARTGDYKKAAGLAQTLYHEIPDPVIFRKYLDIHSRYDMQAALREYKSRLDEQPDPDTLLDYTLHLQENGRLREALDAAHTLVSTSGTPVSRLVECNILADLGEVAGAEAAYERLIADELVTKNDLDLLGLIIGTYRRFLLEHMPVGEAKSRFLATVSCDPNIAGLLETARFLEDIGDAGEARSWYYRAYRADFITGGLEYAKFLSASNEDRECEKVMLYILANIKKRSDLGRVAAVITGENERMHTLRRLMDQLIRRLEEKRSALHSEELELLAIAYSIAARTALDEMDYTGCKYCCLCGMDVMPAQSRAIQLADFLELIRAGKEQSVADRPIMNADKAKKRAAATPPAPVIADHLGLTEQEQKIVGFLKSHRTVSEMDLRRLLGTRRVVGIVNRIIQKAAAQGLIIIEKKGVGEDGEIYEYTGT
jgi:tetratricopeptide (TPR) repeat protein